MRERYQYMGRYGNVPFVNFAFFIGRVGLDKEKQAVSATIGNNSPV